MVRARGGAVALGLPRAGLVSRSGRPRPATCDDGVVTIAVVFVESAWMFLTFLVFFLLAISHGYYTRSGSAINQRPYNNGSGDAPGAEIPSTIGRDVARRDYSRGTR